MQSIEVDKDISVIDLIILTGNAKSKGEARRLIDGKAIKINDRTIENYEDELPEKADKEMIFHKGKKVHLKVLIK